jgi:hypothetical protein
MSRPFPRCTYCDVRAAYADLRRLDREHPPYFRCRDEVACGQRMQERGLVALGEVRGLVSGEAGKRWLGAVRVG